MVAIVIQLACNGPAKPTLLMHVTFSPQGRIITEKKRLLVE